jgi:hypothetical protein
MRAALLFISGAVLGGASGAGVAVYLVGRSVPPPAVAAPEPVEAEAVAEPEAPKNDGDAGRIASLERRLSLLTAAYSKLAGDHAEPGAEPMPSQADVADPVFEAAVLDILDREKERQATERAERRAELQKERSERRAADLSTRLGLNANQTRDLTALMKDHLDAITKLRDGENPPQTRAEWRERVDALTRDSEQKLNSIFTPAQLAEYQKLDSDEKLGGGRGSGRSSGDGQGRGSDAQAR